MSYTIRQLTRDDAQAYRAIRLEALTNHPESYGTSPENFAARPADVLRQRLDQMTFFGAVTESDELVGIVAYQQDQAERETHRGWVMQVYVKPTMRGTGCADALLETVAGHARGQVLQLHLGVGAHNTPAIRLYQRAGYKIYGTDPRCLHVNGRYIDEHLMVRFLDKAPGEQK